LQLIENVGRFQLTLFYFDGISLNGRHLENAIDHMREVGGMAGDLLKRILLFRGKLAEGFLLGDLRIALYHVQRCS
jgi:hypothetical protein